MLQANNRRTLLLAAQFLHEELPIRLARRVRDLKTLPFGLSETGAIKEVRKLYEKSFFQIRRCVSRRPCNASLRPARLELACDMVSPCSFDMYYLIYLFLSKHRSPDPKTADAEEQFTHVLDRMMSEHNNVQATIARGLQELHASGDKRILGACVYHWGEGGGGRVALVGVLVSV